MTSHVEGLQGGPGNVPWRCTENDDTLESGHAFIRKADKQGHHEKILRLGAPAVFDSMKEQLPRPFLSGPFRN